VHPERLGQRARARGIGERTEIGPLAAKRALIGEPAPVQRKARRITARRAQGADQRARLVGVPELGEAAACRRRAAAGRSDGGARPRGHSAGRTGSA